MALTGMDIEAVRQLGTLLKTKADEIQSTMNQLNSQITSSQSIWIGPDADTFRNDWQSSHMRSLQMVIQGLEDASQRATQNATEQESASR